MSEEWNPDRLEAILAIAAAGDAYKRLPAEVHGVIWMRYVEGRSLRSVSNETGLPRSWFRKRERQGLAALGKHPRST